MAEGYQNNNRPNNQKPPNALSEFSLKLVGDPINGAKRPPTLTLTVKKNKPQVEVRTNVEGDKDYGKIVIPMSTPDLFAMFQMIEEAVDSKEEVRWTMEQHAQRWIRAQNSRSKEPMLEGSITIGRTASGIIFIGVKHWESDRPVCKFPIRPVVDYRNATKLYRADGSECDPAWLSQTWARAWVRAMSALMADMIVQEYVAPPPREGGFQGGNNNGGGNGYQNRGGGGGGNYGGNRGGGQQGGGGRGSDFADNGGGWGGSDDGIPM